MPVAYLTTPGLHVALRGERLELEYPQGEPPAPDAPSHIPLIRLEHLVVDVSVRVSLPALAELAERGIPVLIVRHGGKPVGQLHSVDLPTHLLERQVDVSRDDARRTALARQLVCAKMANQRRLLDRLEYNRDLAAPEESEIVGEMMARAAEETELERLRGLEGAGAAAYFRALDRFFPMDVPLERRSHHPAHNAANALLSYLYAMLVGEISLRLRTHGLHPAFGFFHLVDHGRPALALDLAEPFRPLLGDAPALDLLNHDRITPEHFETPEPGRILLSRDARRLAAAAFEERLMRRFHSEHLGHETCLREVLEHEIDALKGALAGQRELCAFRMN